MKITLRKANALQASIGELINKITVANTVTVNEYQNPADVINAGTIELFAMDKKRSQLLSIQYNIRGLIGSANAQSLIDLKLTLMAYVDKRIAQITPMLGYSTIKTIGEVEGKIKKIRDREPSSYLYNDEVIASVVTPEFIQQITQELKLLKRQRQTLSDEILELNIKTEIPLTSEIVTVLTAEGLL